MGLRSGTGSDAADRELRTMTCPHNFEAWNHQLLAQLATDQYNEIAALKEELRLALEAYRLTVIGAMK